VDSSSAKNAFNSLRSSMANKSIGQPPPSAPSAFSAPKRGGPPPLPPSRPKVEEEEPEGEWAEVLYDYSSEVRNIVCRLCDFMRLIYCRLGSWGLGD
jgi:hypothetical protein